MISSWRKILMGLAATAALLAPLGMIVRYETVLRLGTPFRFRARFVDPADPFRGRYVQLHFNLTAPLPKAWPYVSRQTVYARLGQDEQGFAVIEELSRTPWPPSISWVEAQLWGFSDYSNRVVHVQVPFSQFYMNEWKAPRAENEYRQLSQKTSNIWCEVQVWRGKGVIKDLFFEGRPVREYLEDLSKGPTADVKE